MKRLLALALAVFASPATATDLSNPRNRSSGGKQCEMVNVSGTMTNALCVSGTADVGVGTSTPFHYAGYTTLGINGNPGANIDFTTNGVLDAEVNANSSGMNLGTDIAAPVIFNVNTGEKMRLATNGKVAIGTITPSTNQLLTVAGGVSFGGYINDPVTPTSGIWQMQYNIINQGAAAIVTPLVTVDASSNSGIGTVCLATLLTSGATSGTTGGALYGATQTLITCGHNVTSPWCSTIGTTNLGAAPTSVASFTYTAGATNVGTINLSCGNGSQFLACAVTMQCTSFTGGSAPAITNLVTP